MPAGNEATRFKKGNQASVGFGRPPNEGFSDDELEVMGKEILEWAKKCDKENSEIVHLSEWYSEIKDISYTQWRSMCLRDRFRPYYEKSREWMGKRILKNKEFAQSYGNRFLSIYFKEIKEEEREKVEHQIDYEIKRKSEADLSRMTAPNDAHLSMLQDLIQENKELKDKLNASKSETTPVISGSE